MFGSDSWPSICLCPNHSGRPVGRSGSETRKTREHPHVTILRGTKAWRINLRTGAFMDGDPDPAEVPNQLVELIEQEATWQRLQYEWDRMYPNNPVSGDEE